MQGTSVPQSSHLASPPSMSFDMSMAACKGEHPLMLTRVPILFPMRTHSHWRLSNMGLMSNLMHQGCHHGCHRVHHMTMLLPCEQGGTRLQWHHICHFTNLLCTHLTVDHMQKVFPKPTTMHSRLALIMDQTIWAVSMEATEQVCWSNTCIAQGNACIQLTCCCVVVLVVTN